MAAIFDSPLTQTSGSTRINFPILLGTETMKVAVHIVI